MGQLSPRLRSGLVFIQGEPSGPDPSAPLLKLALTKSPQTRSARGNLVLIAAPKGFGMTRCLLALTALTVVLSGCASAAPPGGERLAWDGLGQDPNKPVRHTRRVKTPLPSQPDANAEREKILATLQPYSAAWWIVQDEIAGEEQRRLNNKLVICRGCLRTASPEDQTASVHP
jgi:hypothetical protein